MIQDQEVWGRCACDHNDNDHGHGDSPPLSEEQLLESGILIEREFFFFFFFLGSAFPFLTKPWIHTGCREVVVLTRNSCLGAKSKVKVPRLLILGCGSPDHNPGSAPGDNMASVPGRNALVNCLKMHSFLEIFYLSGATSLKASKLEAWRKRQ